MENADRVVTLLPNAYSYLERFGIPEHKAAVATNDVDISWLDDIGRQLPSCIDMEMNRPQCAHSSRRIWVLMAWRVAWISSLSVAPEERGEWDFACWGSQ